MTDDRRTQALEECIAVAPASEVIVHTLELTHVGLSEPIRVTQDPGDLDEESGYRGLRLGVPDEEDPVLFQACMFDITLPEQVETRLPTMAIALDNVAQEITRELDTIISQRADLMVTYREYLLSIPSAPQFTLSGGRLSRVKVTPTRVTGTVSFGTLINEGFPRKVYRPSEFRGLSQ